MSLTPDQSRLTIPDFKPDTPDDHDKNLRTIERWGNNLPFTSLQSTRIAYSGGTGHVIAPDTEFEVVLYTGSGYKLPAPGFIQSYINIAFGVDTTASSQLVYWLSGDQSVIDVLGQVAKSYVMSGGTSYDFVTLQSAWVVYEKDKNLDFLPTVIMKNGPQPTDATIYSVFWSHVYFPLGTANRLDPENIYF